MNGMSEFLMNMNVNSIFDCCLYCFWTKRLMFIFRIVQNWISCESECKQYFDCCLHCFRTKRLMFVLYFVQNTCLYCWMTKRFVSVSYKVQNCEVSEGLGWKLWSLNVFALECCCPLDSGWAVDGRPRGTRWHAVCMSPDLYPMSCRVLLLELL